MSNAAFSQIADYTAGVIDVMYRQVRCAEAYTSQSTGAVWQTWEDKFNRKVADLTDTTNTLANVEEDISNALNQHATNLTREASIFTGGNYTRRGGG